MNFTKIGAGWKKKGKTDFISCVIEREKMIATSDGKISFLIFQKLTKETEKSPDYDLVQISD